MEPDVNSDTALLTEHFGYPPVSLLDDIINSVNILAERALDSVEKALLSQNPHTLGFRDGAANPSSSSTSDPSQAKLSAEDAHRHEVEAGTHQLETLLCASIDRNFDKFELYTMRNILCVRREDRDWIRLSHYEGLDFSTSKGNNDDDDDDNGKSGADDDDAAATAAAAADAPTLQSVTRLRRRLQASQRLNTMLHAEKARTEALLGDLRAAVGRGTGGVKPEEEGKAAAAAPLAFLGDAGDLKVGDAEAPLATTTAFSLSQLQALRALSTSLRTIVPDLAGASSSGGSGGGGGAGAEAEGSDGRKSWRRERLEYIEGSTRRHLETVRGLELGESGGVRDGEWQGEGRKLAKGEVEGLEKVVTILGGSPEADAAATAKDDEMDES